MSRAALEKAIGARLRQLADAVEEMPRGRWTFCLSNGRRLRVDARLGADWLCLVATPRAEIEGASNEDLVAANAALPGLAKFALDPATGRPQLRAEVPVDAAGECLDHLAAACAGFDRAVALLTAAAPAGGEETASKPRRSRRRSRRRSCRTPKDAAPQPSPAPDVAELCGEAGWPLCRGDAEGGVVELESSRGLLSARLSVSNGTLRARTDLLDWGSLSSESRAALALLLLAGNGLVRMARASIHEIGNGPAAGLEVMCGARPSPALVGQALASLSVAGNLLAPEARAMIAHRLARRYLTVRGGEVEVRGSRTRGESAA